MRVLPHRVPGCGAIAVVLGFACALSSSLIVYAEVQLVTPFGDHMVLQRDRAIPVWGTASVGERVTVTLESETVQTTADGAGNWAVSLRPRAASSLPVTLTVEASNRVTLRDILIGEVWLCSGQSNMHWPLRQAADGRTAMAAANLPQLRLLNLRGEPYPSGRVFTSSERSNCDPSRYLTGQWSACSPETVSDFSAIAFFFGCDLLATQQVPVGLIHNAIGGTPTESWVSRESLEKDAQLRPLLEHWFDNELVHSFCRQRALLNLAGPAAKPAEVEGVNLHPYMPSFMYDSGIKPLAPFPLRGVLWYQGESNAHNAQLHDLLFSKLVHDWRQAWQDSELPFLFVQLPNFASEAATAWPALRESQRRALRIPHTGMAVTIDLGDPADVHPVQKREVASRLALLARQLVYGESLESTGPTIAKITVTGMELHLQFQHAAGGLSTRNNEPLIGFEVAGADELFYPVPAQIEGSQITLRSPVSKPRWVRFSYTPNPTCYLVNQADLPASPFHEAVK